MATSHTLDLTSDMTSLLPLPSVEGFSYYRTSVVGKVLTQERQDPMPGPSLSLFLRRWPCSGIRDGGDLLVGKLRFSEISSASQGQGLQQNTAEQQSPGISHPMHLLWNWTFSDFMCDTDSLLTRLMMLSTVITVIAVRGWTETREQREVR